MNKITWILLILIFPILQNAQAPEIEWGPTYKEKTEEGKGLFSKKLLGTTDDYYYLFATSRKKRHLLQFNYDNELLQTFPINLQYQGEKLYPSDWVSTPVGDYLISSRYDKGTKSKSYFSCPISKDGKIPLDADFLFSHSYLKKNALRNKLKFEKDNDASGFAVSSDSSKTLFYYTESPFDFKKKKGGDFFNIAVFDERMSLMWKKRVEFPYIDDNLELVKMSISDKGRIYALGYVKVKYYRESKFPNGDFVLFEVTENGVKEIDRLRYDEKYPMSASLHLHDDSSIFIIGSYTEGSIKPLRHHGMFFTKYSKEGDKVLLKTFPWKSEITDARKEIRYLNFNHTFINYEKERITVLGESRHNLVNTDGEIKQRYSNYVVVSSFNFDGELQWMNFVKKEFASNHHTPMSFLFAHKDDNIYLIFNDVKNRKEKKNLSAPKSPILIYYFTDIIRINGDGEIDMRETLFNSKDLKFYFNVENSAFIKNGQVLIGGQGIKNLRPDYRFGKMILP